MHMYYITIGDEAIDERLIAVAGNESEARCLANNIGQGSKVRTLSQLLKSLVQIPLGLKWIVESDKKYQKREVEDRTKNLMVG